MTKIDMNDLYNNLKEEAEKRREEQRKEFSEHLKEQRNKEQAKIDEQQKIMDNLSKKYLEKEKNEKEKAAKEEQDRLLNDLAKKQERQFGLKTEDTKKKDNAFKAMAKSLSQQLDL